MQELYKVHEKFEVLNILWVNQQLDLENEAQMKQKELIQKIKNLEKQVQWLEQQVENPKPPTLSGPSSEAPPKTTKEKS